MTTIPDQPFANADIEIDGNSYQGCSFTNCQLIFRAKAPFAFVRCTFSECRFFFDGAAAMTTGAMASLYAGGFQPVVEEIIQHIRDGRLLKAAD